MLGTTEHVLWTHNCFECYKRILVGSSMYSTVIPALYTVPKMIVIAASMVSSTRTVSDKWEGHLY